MAVDFVTASSQYLHLRDSALIDNAGNFSIAAWVTRGVGGVVDWWYNETNTGDDDPCYDFATGGTGLLRWFARNTDGTGEVDINAVTNALAVGTRAHIGFTRVSTTVTFYVNGVPEVFTGITLPTSVSRNTVDFAARRRLGNAFAGGQGEDLRVWNRLVPAAEMRALASGYRRPLGGEVLWATMNDFRGVATPDGLALAATNVLKDLSGNGNDGIPTASPVARASRAMRFGIGAR